MNWLQSSMVEILDDTVAFYSEDVSRRAVNSSGQCEYISFNGNCCAIGRKMNDADLNFIVKNHHECKRFGAVIPNLQTPAIRELPFTFWCDIQGLHDTRENWGERKGLSTKGKIEALRIRTNIEHNLYNN